MISFRNPILKADYSDPDCIRVGEDFYMISSSFNYVPGLPILHSKDLIHWELINYIAPDLIPGFEKVRPGDGIWAPSLRFHNGIFYALIPFPDEGLFVAETSDPFKKWSPLRCLLSGKGYEDPCPLWYHGETYIVFAYVRSRIGFHDRLGFFKADESLTKRLSEPEIIYDGSQKNPDIEGPKAYVINGEIYILAPAGGVEHGWEVCLRSKDIRGPFKEKVILKENGNGIAGTHQGALIDIDEKGHWAFMHFSAKGNLGRITYLEPVSFDKEGYPICGKAGGPVETGELPLVKSDLSLTYDDAFLNSHLSLNWQTPCRVRRQSFLEPTEEGLRIYAKEKGDLSLRYFPYVLSEKIPAFHFKAEVRIDASHLRDGDKAGIGLAGEEGGFVFISREQSHFILETIKAGAEKDEILASSVLDSSSATIAFEFRYPSSLEFSDGSVLPVKKEHWSGLRIGLTVSAAKEKGGYAVFSNLRIIDED
jgi:beta-xylosidase